MNWGGSNTFSNVHRVPDSTSRFQSVIDGDDISSSFSNDQYLGFLKGNIVGIRYYTGMVSNREMVSLQREPLNQYDGNAVRVNNIRGEQVGHIKKEMAKALAAVIDRDLVRVEGLVASGSTNTYSIPVLLSFWGNVQNRDSVCQALLRHGYMLETGQLTNSSKSWSSKTYSQPKSKATALTASHVKKELDSLFENIKEIDQTMETNQCQAIRTKLFKHQRQALCWMINREAGSQLPPFWEKIKTKNGTEVFKNTVTNFQSKVEPKKVSGGILADDMGLGKTLVVISLIAGNLCDSKPMFFAENSKIQEKKYSRKEALKITNRESINIVDVIDLTTDDDSFTEMKVQHSAKRLDVTIPMHRRAVKRQIQHFEDDQCSSGHLVPKKEKRSLRRKRDVKDCDYLPSEAKIRLTQEREIPLKFMKRGKSKPTLIVCPLSVISNWESQINEHIYDSANLKHVIYHGSSKNNLEKQILTEKDVVITTYQTLAHEFKKLNTTGCLLSIEWLRIVLDEGHMIRNPNALQTKACCSLKAKTKWILTGTPIQNSIKDLWAIVLFLGLEPFTDRSWWRRTIERPLNEGDSAALKRIQCLMGSICMRRTKHQKINGKRIIDLPTREVFLQKVDLSPDERISYNKIDEMGKKTIAGLINDGLVMTRYADVLVLLMRLRQICCHPYLVKEILNQFQTGCVKTHNEKDSSSDLETSQLVSKMIVLLSSGSVEECSVCLDPISLPVITKCAHIFCKPCITEVISFSKDKCVCPLCRTEVKQIELIEMPPDVASNEISGDDIMYPSAKISALMCELMKLKNSNEKSLVVSQFTSFLKIIEKHLQKEKIESVLFHGGMSASARNEAIMKLQSGNAIVMLISLRSGGLGLNLTAASRVFLMEPAWNPAVEEQCFDRVHRLGQTNAVKITKFICKNSVEEKITEIQSAKRNVAANSLQRRSPEERKQQTLEELRTLINI